MIETGWQRPRRRGKLRAMKTQKLYGCSLALLLTLLALRSDGAPEAQAASTNRHSLWKVTGPHATVYLLGSVHLMKADDYPLAVPMEAAFRNAAVVAFETEIGEMEGPGTQAKVMAKAMLPEGQTFQGQLSANTYAMFTNCAAELRLPMLIFDKLKPALAAMTVVVLEVQKLGFDPLQGIDLHFYKLARQQDKTVLALETVDFQLDLLTSFSKEESEMLVKSTIEEIATMKQSFGDLLRAWKTGDAATLEQLLNTAEREAPVVFKRLVSDRNERWVPKIEELARGEKNAIFIVGAGHLVGPGGVLELLRARGWKVTQE